MNNHKKLGKRRQWIGESKTKKRKSKEGNLKDEKAVRGETLTIKRENGESKKKKKEKKQSRENDPPTRMERANSAIKVPFRVMGE